MTDSNVYVVSPPTLYLPGGGLAFCLISNNKVWQDTVVSLVEKNVQHNQLTFYTNESGVKDPKAWIWYWHIADNCDIIICDMASSSEHEIRMAMAMAKADQPVIFSTRPGSDEFVSLLNSVGIPSFEETDELLRILELALG